MPWSDILNIAIPLGLVAVAILGGYLAGKSIERAGGD